MRIIETPIEEDLRKSYLTYAMSVIVARAIPDVRDGLKPVHRRILYVFYENGIFHNKPYKKSARIVGDVLGKYHPHGDAAIYDALVRMAQPFSMRYPLVDGHGNFGSIDGDPPAAMRYTEVRLAKIAEEMLQDIEKDTVDFVPNFDNSLKEPVVLPTKLPNLLVNGSSGIAVGMATNIPPHNLREVVDALIAYIDGAGEEEILDIIQGPDFPTGGYIVGREDIRKAYRTGRGIIKVRAKARIKDNYIYIEEIPYQITKARILEEIVQAVKSGKVKDVVDLQDRSDKRGLLIEVKLKRGANAEVVLNQLYKHTSLETSYSIINVALVDKKPQQLSLYSMLGHFVAFRREVVRRRTAFLLKKAEERLHIVKGLLKALEKIEEVVELVRKAKDVGEAKEGLKAFLGIDEKQAEAILQMRLSRLTALERGKLEEERRELEEKIAYYKKVLSSPEEVDAIIKAELRELKEKYGDERRTEIIEAEEVDVEDLIQDKDVLITLSRKGYVNRILLEELRAQRRGGKGVLLSKVEALLNALEVKNKDTILFFSNLGRVFALKAYQIPLGGRGSKGVHFSSIINAKEGEQIVEMVAVREWGGYLVFLTQKGLVKKTPLKEFSHVRRSGIRAIVLRDDAIVDVKKVKDEDIAILTKMGRAIRFPSSEVRAMGRNAAGVRGIKLQEGDEAVSLAILTKPYLFIISETGYGKRVKWEEFRGQHRGGGGLIAMPITEKTKAIARGISVAEERVIVATEKGKGIMVEAARVPLLSRYAQGVRIMKVEEGDKVVSITPVKEV